MSESAELTTAALKMSLIDKTRYAANAQDEHARLVIAHEIGHLILHRDQVFAFSRGLEKKLGFLAPEESAEQQANWFAAALLLPDQVMRRLSKNGDYVIATLALVGEQLVRVRRREVEMDTLYQGTGADPDFEYFAKEHHDSQFETDDMSDDQIVAYFLPLGLDFRDARGHPLRCTIFIARQAEAALKGVSGQLPKPEQAGQSNWEEKLRRDAESFLKNKAKRSPG